MQRYQIFMFILAALSIFTIRSACSKKQHEENENQYTDDLKSIVRLLKRFKLKYQCLQNNKEESLNSSRHDNHNRKLTNETAEIWIKRSEKLATDLSRLDALVQYNIHSNTKNKYTKALRDLLGEVSDQCDATMYNHLLWFDRSDLKKSEIGESFNISLGHFAVHPENKDLQAAYDVGKNITDIYEEARVCLDGRCMDNDQLEVVLQKTKDYDKAQYIWKEWRNATGRKMRKLFEKKIRLYRKAKHNPSKNWNENSIRDPNVPEMVTKLWKELAPLYNELHAYVRHHLIKLYPGKLKRDGPIPAHLFREMYGLNWDMLTDEMLPFPKSRSPDFSDEIKQMNPSPNKIFKMAEDFFTSMGMPKMTDKFWKYSHLEQRKDGGHISCHGTAWDMSARQKNDYRILYCAEPNMVSFQTAHHEMGHVQYYMAYKDQPISFRKAGNSAFHEATGDTVTLSAMSLNHLHTLKIFPGDDAKDTGTNINYLFNMAMVKLPLLPYALCVAMWRWKLYDGSTPLNEMNQSWWDLRKRFQGIVAPVNRSEEDLDAASKYHIAYQDNYIVYFLSVVVQFEFYQSLCKESGHTGPLHLCDFYQSKKAGKKFSNFLKLGASIPWRKAKQQFTGSPDIKADALLSYFQPLYTWLHQYNSENNVHIGW